MPKMIARALKPDLNDMILVHAWPDFVVPKRAPSYLIYASVSFNYEQVVLLKHKANLFF